MRAHAEQLGLDVPEQWVFEDDGHSGASLVRPALERLRDLVCQVPVDVLLVYSPDRLARKYAYQALLIEEFAKAGTTVMFVKGPRSDSPEDALLVQFQGMIAEYERAQILERTRRGKAHRAKSGTINVLSGAPFGYRYVRKSEHAEARYEIVAHEAAIVAELFARYADGGVAIGELARWLSGLGVATRTGKPRWDRSTVWGMLRNPAYAGWACFGKTMRTDQTAGLNRTARLAGRATPRPTRSSTAPAAIGSRYPCPRWSPRTPGSGSSDDWPTTSATPPATARIPRCCKAFAPAVAAATPTIARRPRTTNKKIYYYRCLGSDDYRYEHGRVCANKPVRADYLDTVVWDHITALLADPALIRDEINKRLEQVRTADPATAQRQRLDAGTGQGHHGDHPAHRRLPGGVDLPRRAPRPACPSCAPARPACTTRSTRSTANSPTGRSTSSSPTTSKTSSPGCAARPPQRPSPNASASCACSSKTFSSAPKRSPSATPSRCGTT